ncbi:hypothetical protein KSD_38440 [Ktedonobacter sp. SOSP1-85]|uniref:hypothetical protein n=1 Tax=Ktedonobacter sp. SOSP1-85 TaxID=2778367 RepID=UPI0019156978|nr:hypothetical protein [Ktedonobacter sp. SOSP1-85]GHO76073.1 hypothetical protein KSD_38440 [Ktedonobacter sp. SOSP1-85]
MRSRTCTVAIVRAWTAPENADQSYLNACARIISKARSWRRCLRSTIEDEKGTLAGLYNALPDDLADIQKGDFRRRLGKALSYRVGTQFDESGLHLVKGEPDTRSGAVYWSVAFPEPEVVSL